MKTAGLILKENREKKDLTIKEVSDVIKIRVEYLDALEKDDYKAFASPIYAKGFLKNYAKFLGVSDDHILALYRRDTEEKSSGAIKDLSKVSQERSLVLTPQIVISVLIGLFVIGIVGYLISQFYVLRQAPELKVTTPSDGETVDTTEIAVRGVTAPGATLTINGEAVKVSEDGAFETKITLEDGANTIIVKAKGENDIGDEAVREIQVFLKDKLTDFTGTGEFEASDDITSPGGGNSNPTPADTLEVKIEVGDSAAWIEVDVDGTRKLANILQAGESREFTAKEEISLLTGKLSSTKVIVNGIEQTFQNVSGVGRMTCMIESGVDEGFVCE